MLCFQTQLQIYCRCEDIKKGYENFYLGMFDALYVNSEEISYEQIADTFATNTDMIKRFRRDIAKIATALLLLRLRIFEQGKIACHL